MISRVIPPDEKNGTNRHEPKDRPDRKTKIHHRSMTERNDSHNGTLSHHVIIDLLSVFRTSLKPERMAL